MGSYRKTNGAIVTANSMHTILFDFDGTLVFHEPDSFDVISAYCADIGQPLSAEAAREGRRTRHEYFVDPIIRDELAGLSSDDFWKHFNRHLLAALCVKGDLDRLAEEVTDRFVNLELTYHCPEAGFHTLSELRSRGYGLGLITNRINVERFHQLLTHLDLWSYFELVLASGEVGIRKPDPGIFYAALDRIGARAEECLYVGDNYWADVVGAERAGVKPALFDPYHLFPEAECLILECMDDLLKWLL
jgi:HAD superfamily hydrolase (TIGR01549 family)